MTSRQVVSLPVELPRLPPLRLLGVLFFLSGTSSLVLETLFTRLLSYTFGNTAYAASTVLAAFLGGADGVILSRKYSEMKLANLGGAGEAIKQLKLG